MSPDSRGIGPTRDDDEVEQDYGPEQSSSIFATTWFRATVVAVVLAVVGIISVPYILDWLRPPEPASTAMAPAVTESASPPPASDSAGDAPPPASDPIPPVAPLSETSGESPSQPDASVQAQPPAPTHPVEPRETESPRRSGSVEAPAEPREATPARIRPGTSGERSREQARSARHATPATPLKPAESSPVGTRGGGPFWVQVGAFRDPAHARAMAAKLREGHFEVEEAAPTGEAPRSVAPRPDPSLPGSPVDRYDVFVGGAPPAEIQATLERKGLAADPVAGGAVITPSLPLRDAVTLSKDLAAEGLKVQVRRATVEAPASRDGAGGEPAVRGARDEFHRVRVGGFPDRASAEAARQALAARGYAGFVTKSGP
jgi:cell division protein FtsN